MAEGMKPEILQQIFNKILPIIIEKLRPQITELVNTATSACQDHIIKECDWKVSQIFRNLDATDADSQPNAFEDLMTQKIKTDLLKYLGQALNQQLDNKCVQFFKLLRLEVACFHAAIIVTDPRVYRYFFHDHGVCN